MKNEWEGNKNKSELASGGSERREKLFLPRSRLQFHLEVKTTCDIAYGETNDQIDIFFLMFLLHSFV